MVQICCCFSDVWASLLLNQWSFSDDHFSVDVEKFCYLWPPGARIVINYAGVSMVVGFLAKFLKLAKICLTYNQLLLIKPRFHFHWFSRSWHRFRKQTVSKIEILKKCHWQKNIFTFSTTLEWDFFWNTIFFKYDLRQNCTVQYVHVLQIWIF